jgi:hypothetical protein
MAETDLAETDFPQAERYPPIIAQRLVPLATVRIKICAEKSARYQI